MNMKKIAFLVSAPLILFVEIFSLAQPAISQSDGNGYNLAPPLEEINVCLSIENIGSGYVECEGLGGNDFGKAGIIFFDSDRPMILTRFSNLSVGTHTLKTRYYSYDSSVGRFVWAGREYDQNMTFRNSDFNWDVWFPARIRRAGNWKVEIFLDGYWHGDADYSMCTRSRCGLM